MRRLIVNADDLGYTAAINHGILEAHERGIVTSASLMVDRPGGADGAALARATPSLSVGLHAVHEPRFYGEPAIGVDRLLAILETLPEGDSELGCHPGYADGLASRYTTEREAELRTLTDPRVRAHVDELGIELIGWREL